MNSTTQPGMHPDAESLTAFAEQMLPAAEREEILAHMSSCGRCREVVFLAQQGSEEDQPVAAAADLPRRPRAWWFSWRWAWIPATACAGLIGFAVVHHYQGVATETQTAVNVAPADAFRATGSPKVEAEKAVTRNEPKPASPTKSANMIAERKMPSQTVRRDEAKKLDEKEPADQKDLALTAGAPPAALAPGVAGGSMRGTLEARAKAAPMGGPSAVNQLQQSAANQQNELQSVARAPQLDAASQTANAPTTPRQESETVTVQAQTVIPTPPVATSAAEQVSVIPTTEQNKAVSLAGAAGLIKKEKVSLPDGLQPLSVASGGDRTIALDTTGALFLSEDGGKHWKPVRTQWTGRAVLVRGLNTAEKGNAVGVQGALKMSPTPRFELVTDDFKTWLSVDGNMWTLQAMPGK